MGTTARRSPVRPARRSFLERAWLGWLLFSSSFGITLAAVARFLFADARGTSSSRIRLGPVDGIALSGVDGRWSDRGIWVVRDADRIWVLSGNCTHLGCSVRWMAAEEKFKCPCHGSGFRRSGLHFEGPAPRPLERLQVNLLPDGDLEVDVSRRFHGELGQWNDPDAYVDLSHGRRA